MHKAGLPEILADKTSSNLPSVLVQISADNFVSDKLLKHELAVEKKPLDQLYPPSDIFIRINEGKFTDLQTFREQNVREQNLVFQELADDLNRMTIREPALRGLGQRSPAQRSPFGR